MNRSHCFTHFFALAIFLNFVVIINSKDILFLLPLATKSHKNVFEPLYKALADRGHNVTVVSPVHPKGNYTNVREIVPVPYDDLIPDFPNPFERRKSGRLTTTMAANVNLLLPACERIYRVPEFVDLINHKFDLVFLNGFANDCFAGVVYKIGSPFIMMVSMAPPNYIASLVGNHLPPSFVPFTMLPFTDEMNLIQRTANFVMNVAVGGIMWWSYGSLDEIARKHLGSDLPSISEIEKNVSMILTNSYFPLTYSRPLLPDIVEVGGMHCRPAKSLPKELDDFLSGAEEGFIYFSMGSVVDTDLMPEDTRRKFLNAFKRLKQRVVWKWNSGKMDDLPANVRVNKWLPQQDILGHPNIKVFMTHGGLLSTQEAAYHGVPVLGIPIFADQDLNMKQATAKGYGLTLEVLDFTEETLEELLRKLIEDPKYWQKAKELSSVIRDQPQTPLERAVYWSEYVIRHRGAKHMRSAARELNVFQYYSLDVIALIMFVLAILITSSVALCRRLFCKSNPDTSTSRVGSKKDN